MVVLPASLNETQLSLACVVEWGVALTQPASWARCVRLGLRLTETRPLTWPASLVWHGSAFGLCKDNGLDEFFTTYNFEKEFFFPSAKKKKILHFFFGKGVQSSFSIFQKISVKKFLKNFFFFNKELTINIVKILFFNFCSSKKSTLKFCKKIFFFFSKWNKP